MRTIDAREIRSRRLGLRGTLIAAAALCALAAPASAQAAPVLELESSHYPQTVPAGTHVQYTLKVSNAGDATTNAPIAVTFSAPAGLTVTKASGPSLAGGFVVPWSCSLPDSQTATCTGAAPGLGAPGPGQEACVGAFAATCRITVLVKADPGASPGSILAPTASACGGGHTTCPAAGDSLADPIEVGGPPSFDVRSFDGGVLRQNGDPETQAGAYPHRAFTEFFLTSVITPDGAEPSTEDLKDTTVRIPPGLVGNPRAVPTCTQVQVALSECPPESQVGKVIVWFSPGLNDNLAPGNPNPFERAVYNMKASHGTPALFAFNVANAVIQVYANVRTGEDYGVTVRAKNAPQTLNVAGVTFTFWGVPADPVHDAERYCAGGPPPCATAAPLKPLISLPTSCEGPGPNDSVETFLEVTSWEGGLGEESFLSHDNTEPVPNPIGNEGCSAVPFAPTLQARPTTNVADSPSGLDVELAVPQNNETCNPGPPVSCGIATAHLRDTTVTLPEGLVVNPSSANGLGSCSLAQFGYTSTDPDGRVHTTPGPARCPNASRLARVEVESQLVDHTLHGSVFLAHPFENPFDSLLALYIAIEDPETGVVVKVPGEVSADPRTGRLTATFQDNPQLPFERFRLHFFGGAGGSLRTPASCGTYTTASELTPWTAPAGQTVASDDTWAIQQGAGGNCAERSHAPSFDAGTISPIAGAHSPFVVRLRREGGSQEFSELTLSPPPGLVAKLAATVPCPEEALAAAAQRDGRSEQASPSCPAASEVGQAIASAGAGPAPYHAPGKAYIAGPYKGAPLSLAILTPAVAGPFDLGTVVVRTALHVDPKTTRITAVADPIPHIIDGIPLDVRAIDVRLDRPEFTLNPTSCDPMEVNGALLSTFGQSATLQSRFQLGECGRLGFKPRMALTLKGGTKRGKHPALTAVLEPRPGDANIAAISVALPPSEFLDQGNIGTVCTRVQWAADACPAASVYGTAHVTTPLLAESLSGKVYLRSSDNKLPDLVPDLRGPANLPIRIEAAGRTDTVKGGLRNTFDLVPDAAFSRFVLQLEGGPNKGLLINSRNICAKPYRATVKAIAHNGKRVTLRPKLRARCPKQRRGKGKAKGRAQQRDQRRAATGRGR